jgi:TonB family protein
MKAILHAKMEEYSPKATLAMSLGLHFLVFAVLLLNPLIRLGSTAILIGSGPGGGRSGEQLIAVGLADDGGGSGMYKPSLTPQPPVLKDNPPPDSVRYPSKTPKLERDPNLFGVDIPELNKQSKKDSGKFKASKPAPQVPPNYIPVPSGPGAGGAGRSGGGSGGGAGGGQGVSLGQGSGGFGDSWYARAVERRISENWLRSLFAPSASGKFQAIVSFLINPGGNITDVKIDKSSGDSAVDLSATRAVTASNPLPPVPPEFRNQVLKIMAYFEYPPSP